MFCIMLPVLNCAALTQCCIVLVKYSTDQQGPAVICGYCEQEGHIKANCPDDKLPVVKPLPPMTADHLNMIDRVIGKVIRE